MKKLLLITTIIIFTLGGSLGVAQEQEVKTSEVLNLELQVLRATGLAIQNNIRRIKIEIGYLNLLVPKAEAELNKLNAQIREKVSEIKSLEEPKGEVKEKP